nr:facilitated trehalose transporter Tret1-like [Aedes albopictus]
MGTLREKISVARGSTQHIAAIVAWNRASVALTNAVVEPELATIIIGSIQVFGTLLSSLVVDRLGRRVLLLTSGSAMCIGVTADGASNQTGWIPIVALCLYVTLFAVGFGPVPWLLLGEIFASEVKGPASALANMTSFAMSFVLSLVFPLVRQAIGSGPMFIIFSVFCALAVVFVALVVPETKVCILFQVSHQMDHHTTRRRFGLERVTRVGT